MKRSLLGIFLLLGISFGLPAEYKLLIKFREEGDIGAGLFLNDNYPEAVFIHELKIELATLLLQRGERNIARKVLRGIDLDRVRDSYGERAVHLWRELGLEKRVLVLRFPELATDMLENIQLSGREWERVFSRLLKHKRYKALLSFKNLPCYYKVSVLYRTKRLTEAIKEGKRCNDRRVKGILFLAFIRSGNLEGAERLAREDSNIAHRLARHLIEEGELERAKRLLMLHDGSPGALFLSGVISFAQGRLRSAYELFSESINSTKSERERAKVHFWIFKTLTLLGYPDIASHHLRLASTGEGFYSLVAKAFLGEEVKLPPAVSLSQQRESKLVSRFSEIARAGFLHYMREEALQRSDMLEIEDIVLLSRTDPYIALKIAIRRLPGGSPILYSLFYPTPFKEEVMKASEKTGVSPALIYAVMKQESLFDPLAVSRSGAMGLMQLLDSTARWKAKRVNLELKDIFDPETNIYLGSAYLRYLLDMWKGDLVKTLASYNAGQGRVSKWKDYEDRFLFIEMIPYRETRNYVKKVLRNYYIYSLMLRGSCSQDTQPVSCLQTRR